MDDIFIVRVSPQVNFVLPSGTTMRLVPAILIASLAAIVGASGGDEAPEYMKCVGLCMNEHCVSPPRTTLPLALRITRWTCTDDCKYNCMHAITDEVISQGNPVLQYRRKWPLWRFAGIQEPASVALSLLNLLAHAQGAEKIRRRVPKNHPMRSHYLLWAIASLNAWVWTTVYHTRGFPVFEILRYASAFLANLYTWYYTRIRLDHSHPPLSSGCLTRPPKTLKRRVTPFIWVTAFTVQCLHATLLPPPDDNEGLIACFLFFDLVLSLDHSCIWLSRSGNVGYFARIPSRPQLTRQEIDSLSKTEVLYHLYLLIPEFTVDSYRPEFLSVMWYLHQRMTFVTTLGIFEFAPWRRVIDAQALWKLLTFLATRRWYNLLVVDSLDPGWREPNAMRRRRNLSPDCPTKRMRKEV